MVTAYDTLFIMKKNTKKSKKKIFESNYIIRNYLNFCILLLIISETHKSRIKKKEKKNKKKYVASFTVHQLCKNYPES